MRDDITTGPQHEAFRQDFIAVLRKHVGTLPAGECLAIAAAATGQIMGVVIREFGADPAEAFAMVMNNVAEGNNMAQAEMDKERKRAN